MRYAICLLWVSLNVANACDDPSQQESVTKHRNKTKTASLQPVPDSEKEIECRVLDMSTGVTTTVKGRQAVYMSGPKPSYNHRNFRIRVTAFSYQDTHWIGLSGDLFIYRKGTFIGMAINGEGLAWLTNFAGNNPNRSLNDDIKAFQHEVPLDQLYHVFLRKWQRDLAPNEPKEFTNIGDVIPNPYVTYLYMTGRPTVESAAVDGKLLKITLSDQTKKMLPSLWVDLKTKKAVKAENYKYDPDAQDRELLKR